MPRRNTFDRWFVVLTVCLASLSFTFGQVDCIQSTCGEIGEGGVLVTWGGIPCPPGQWCPGFVEVFRACAAADLETTDSPPFRLGQTTGSSWVDVPDCPHLCQFYKLDYAEIAVEVDVDAFVALTATDVTFEATVPQPPGGGDSINSVTLVVPGGGGGPLCTLLDNGNASNGDTDPGDSIYSCIVSFTESSGELDLQVVADATVDSSPRSLESGIMQLKVVEPLTLAERNTIDTRLTDAANEWSIQQGALGNTLAAREKVACEVGQLAGVLDVDGDCSCAAPEQCDGTGVADDELTIWIEFTTGIVGGLALNPPTTLGAHVRDSPVPQSSTPPAPWLAQSSVTSPAERDRDPSSPVSPSGIAPGNLDVLIWAPFTADVGTLDETAEGLFDDAICPDFTVTHLTDAQADVASVADFPDYGTLFIASHGGTMQVGGSSQVYFLTGEATTPATMATHQVDLRLRRLAAFRQRLAVLPAKFDGLGLIADGPEDPHSMVHFHVCSGLRNDSMAAAFSRWADVVYGFTDVTFVSFAESVANQVIPELINLETAGDAYDAVSPKDDPTSCVGGYWCAGDNTGPAIFEVRGSETAAYPACR